MNHPEGSPAYDPFPQFSFNDHYAAIKERYRNIAEFRSSSDLIEYSLLLSSVPPCKLRRPG
ncbi:hypothetical protein WH47_12661 [Habropoda laboriosa]|uniref:Uncharacterized protein n=1 Tax=Habropoda laboriosa TaxID=597456 RepID=A0A0L7QKC1_9HYME|nr:hypothetical protein WH47_12661 [Habropoda laboriosa]